MYRALHNILLTITIGVAFISTSTAASANGRQASVGNISYSGSACPASSVSVSLSNNKEVLSVKFKKYAVNATGRNNRKLRKKCNIVIPLKVRAGWSVSLVSSSYNGQLALPAGSQSSITNVYSFAGQRGSRFHANFTGPKHDSYRLHDPLSNFANVWSSCGGSTTIRITSSMLVKPNQSTSNSQQGFTTQLRYRKCS